MNILIFHYSHKDWCQLHHYGNLSVSFPISNKLKLIYQKYLAWSKKPYMVNNNTEYGEFIAGKRIPIYVNPQTEFHDSVTKSGINIAKIEISPAIK